MKTLSLLLLAAALLWACETQEPTPDKAPDDAAKVTAPDAGPSVDVAAKVD